MRRLRAAALLAAALLASPRGARSYDFSQPPALPGRGAPISPSDRVYTGDQTSNTITVIAPFTNTVLGTLPLGDPRLSDVVGPQYRGVVNAHGLGFSRDGALLVSLGVTSNSVTVIRTADNSVVSQTTVDRQSHEGFFAADNRTVWVATRGVDFIDIVDGIAGGIVGRVPSAGGPSKVLFSPDGATAYANHVRNATLDIIDVASRAVVHTIDGLADSFSSDMMLSADGRSLWVAHKMVGKVSVIDVPSRRIVAVVDTGPETNHPNFAVVNGTNLAFVTVAALNATRVYAQPRADAPPTWLADVRSSGVEPHGLWPSADNTRMYVINEHSDTVDVIDTSSLSVIATLNVGQEGQALVYVSNAVPLGSSGTQRLGTQGLTGAPAENVLLPVRRARGALPDGAALLTVRRLPGVDMVQIIGRALTLNATYDVSAVCSACAGAPRVPLLDFKASVPMEGGMHGCATAPQVLAFFKFLGVYDLGSVAVTERQS
jgi:YVTN family beta-propeller protein